MNLIAFLFVFLFACFFFFQAEDGIRYIGVTGVQTCALPIYHGEVVGGALFVAGGDAAEPLGAVDQALHPVAPPVGGAVEAGPAALVALARDHRPDAPPRSEEHTSELQSRQYLGCRLLLEKKKLKYKP